MSDLASLLEKVAVDDLAQIIRHVDGNHSLGAGELAEAILAALSPPSSPRRLPMVTDGVKLLPCPFCGGAAVKPNGEWGGWFIVCDECACQTERWDTEANAIEAWNRRSPPIKAGEAVPVAWRDVLAERRRQVEAEGWTPEHDDQHRSGQLADAAARYAASGSGTFPDERTSFLWPWAASWWKPSDARRNLVKAGALILAEIERLDRAALSHTEQRETK